MEFKKFLSRVLSMTTCMVMVFTTCSFAEPVMEVADHQHEEEVFTYDVETPVEEQGEVSLAMEMPDVFDEIEVIDPGDLPELDIDSDCYTHVFRNGVCVSCGEVCDHPEGWQYSMDSCTRYEQLDQRVHTAYYVKEVYCGECDSILKRVTEEKGWEEGHWFYELDGETGMEICENCGFIRENPDAGDDTNTCTHPNLEDYGLSEEWDEDEGEIIALDENGHTITKVEYYSAHCPDCGWGTWGPTGKSKIVTERHDWDRRGSICSICGVVCKHPNVVKQNSWMEREAEFEAIDVTGHKVTLNLWLALRCIDCNKALVQKTDQTVEYTEPHILCEEKELDSGIWVFIGYRCNCCDYLTTDENVYEGEEDSQWCTHSNMTQELRYRYNGIEKFDVRNHKVNYEACLVDVCPDCGVVNWEWENEERVPESDYTAIEPHEFWTNGDPEEYPFSYCPSCCYFVECDHANATYTEMSEAFVYSNITETTHDSVGAEYDIFYCPDCGIMNRSANGKQVIETEEPHKFEDGVCACGYACVHTPELKVWDEFECTEETHTIDHYELEKCTKCSYIIMETQSSKTEAHDMKDGICTVCGFGDIHTVVLPETMKLGLKESAVMPMSYLPAVAENTVRFESSNKSVVTIDAETGKMTAKKTGKATITATASEGVLATCVVSVQKAPTSVKPSVSKLTLGVGEGYTMGVKLSSGSASNQITYSSSKPDVATIDENGVITPVSSGTTKITVKTFNKKSGTATLTVKAAPETATITTTETTLSVGQTARLSAQLLDGAGKATAGAYTYSIDSDCATLENGVVTATQAGTINAIVTAYNGVTANVTIEILPAPDKAVASVESATLGVGEKLTVTAEIENGSPADFKYKSSKSSVASVTSSGKITAKKAGKATITIQPHAGEAATVQITVKNAPKSVKVSAKSKTLAVGETFRLTAAPNSGAASKITWKSSKSSVATVDQNGNITAVNPGKATITASTFNGKKATCTVTVKAAPTSITLSAARDVLSVGQKVKLSVALNKNSAGTYAFSVQPEGKVTIEKGYIVAHEASDTPITITATTYNGLTSSVTVNVLPAPDKALVDVADNKITLRVKKSYTLKPYIANGSPADFKYKSSKSSVATVSSSGKITAKKKGTAKITITPHIGEPVVVTVVVK